MSEVEVICLGVGDGLASTGRNHSAFLYRLAGTMLLVDCGEPVGRSYQATGLGPDAIDAILLSHLHFDHLGGFFMLLQGLKLEGRSRELPVYLPKWGLEPVRNLVNAALFQEHRATFPLTFHTWTHGEAVPLGDAIVTPLRTGHMARMEEALTDLPKEAFDCFAFRIEAAGKRIGHSSDIGSPEDLVPLLEDPTDLLICELAHFAPSDLYAFLYKKSVRQLALVHLSRELWAQRESVLTEARTALPGVEIVLPNDGDVIEL